MPIALSMQLDCSYIRRRFLETIRPKTKSKVSWKADKYNQPWSPSFTANVKMIIRVVDGPNIIATKLSLSPRVFSLLGLGGETKN